MPADPSPYVRLALATTLIGLATRIAAKICAYTYAFLVNRLLGRPQGRSRSCGPEILATLIQRRLQFLGLLEVAVATASLESGHSFSEGCSSGECEGTQPDPGSEQPCFPHADELRGAKDRHGWILHP